MPTRRHLLLSTPALLLAACAQTPDPTVAAAKAAHHGVTFVYIGADDCPPCLTWRKRELPKWEASATRQKVESRQILAAHYSYVSDPYYWPADLLWIKDDTQLTRGAPQYVVAKDGKVLLRTFGTGSWPTEVLPLLQRLAASG